MQGPRAPRCHVRPRLESVCRCTARSLRQAMSRCVWPFHCAVAHARRSHPLEVCCIELLCEGFGEIATGREVGKASPARTSSQTDTRAGDHRDLLGRDSLRIPLYSRRLGCCIVVHRPDSDAAQRSRSTPDGTDPRTTERTGCWGRTAVMARFMGALLLQPPTVSHFAKNHCYQVIIMLLRR